MCPPRVTLLPTSNSTEPISRRTSCSKVLRTPPAVTRKVSGATIWPVTVRSPAAARLTSPSERRVLPVSRTNRLPPKEARVNAADGPLLQALFSMSPFWDSTVIGPPTALISSTPGLSSEKPSVSKTLIAPSDREVTSSTVLTATFKPDMALPAIMVNSSATMLTLSPAPLAMEPSASRVTLP